MQPARQYVTVFYEVSGIRDSIMCSRIQCPDLLKPFFAYCVDAVGRVESVAHCIPVVVTREKHIAVRIHAKAQHID